jgi:hypothetical protein
VKTSQYAFTTEQAAIDAAAEVRTTKNFHSESYVSMGPTPCMLKSGGPGFKIEVQTYSN